MDCQVTNCYLYNKDCFYKTILVRKPDPKNGCSYYRKMKKENKSVDIDKKDIINNQPDKKKKKEKPTKKRKKEANSLKELL